MKKRLKFSLVVFTCSMFVFFQACRKTEPTSDENSKKAESLRSVELTFLNGAIKETLYLKNGVWVPKTEKIIKREYKDSKSSQIIYGYTYLKSIGKTSSAINKTAKSPITTSTGLYGWNGRCFVWGTLIRNEEGVELFFPADYTTQSLLNVCPGPNEAFAKAPKN